MGIGGLVYVRRFELPTTWFEATYSFRQISAQPCRLLYIGVPK